MLELFFITSNRSKLDHARYLCRQFNIIVSKQKQYGIGYEEPKIRNRNELLEISIRDAVNRLKKVSNTIDEKFVFIEDTSVIIEAFSSPAEEVPGVDIKYWMGEMTFAKLDNMLRAKGNNRSVTVRSDIVLFLPSILQKKFNAEYKHFSSETSGSIVTEEKDFSTNPLYPWLDNKTFNKWFIPEGYDVALSQLSIEEAESVDFRKGAFDGMIDFLRENGLVKRRPNSDQKYKQLNLFNQSLFIVCGNSCAGKTTIADYLTNKYAIYHIEASDFMYLSYYEKHGPNSDVKIGDFAREALMDNPTIVVDQIIRHLNSFKKGRVIPVVISGFRSPDEIRHFKIKYPGDLDVQDVFIDASFDIRFKRSVTRGRGDGAQAIEDFRKIDEQQNAMGLSIIKEKIGSENMVKNEGSFEEYFLAFEQRFQEPLGLLSTYSLDFSEQKKFGTKESKLENAILMSLSRHREEYLTTTRIAHLINSLFEGVRLKGKDNVSRYFNYKYHPYYEIKVEEGKIKYKLSQTGYSYAKIVKRDLQSEG